MLNRFLIPLLVGLFASVPALSQEPVVWTVHPETVVRSVPPGAVGWGAMWKRDQLWPAPPAEMDDEQHAEYMRFLAKALLPRVEAADLRNVSWPWGVSFSTWAVNWENSARPWSERPMDCARFLGRVSPWCERTVVGVGDLVALADYWQLEAVTVAVPLAVIDGDEVRWGPGFFDHVFSDETIDLIADHAAALVDFMRQQPGWAGLQRVYLEAGCEWRHYGLVNPSPAVLSYARLVRRIRQRIPDEKVVVVASASDSTDIPGIPHLQALSWNQYLYEELVGLPGVALDLHRYRGREGLAEDAAGRTPFTDENVDRLLTTGRRQRGYLTVQPEDWGGDGPAMPSVLLENAIHGRLADHSTRSDEEPPWVVALAHSDLLREALASPAMTFLGWTWFPEDLPAEWPHGALSPTGDLTSHARAQAFLSRYHRGSLIESTFDDESPVRANAVADGDGRLRFYGGNFSRESQSLVVEGAGERLGWLEILGEDGLSWGFWRADEALSLPPLSLWRWYEF